jgi:hypothetical protein
LGNPATPGSIHDEGQPNRAHGCGLSNPGAPHLDRLRGAAHLAAFSLAVLALGFTSPTANAQANEWAWMGGSSNTVNQPGVYGTLGTPAPGNIPGDRGATANWTDNQGNFWLFGGDGIDSAGTGGSLNDLWEFNPSTREWAWMS